MRLLTSHTEVLFQLAKDPNQTIRVTSQQTNLTERRVAQIISELEKEGWIKTAQVGRRAVREVTHATQIVKIKYMADEILE